MNKYHSGYFLTLHQNEFSPKEYSDERIKESFLKLVPSNYNGPDWKIDWIYSNNWNGLEFIVSANDFEKAQNVLFNVLCSSSVIDGKNYLSNEAHYPHEFGTSEKIEPLYGLSNPSIPKYFYLASLASKDIKLENSIVKYHLSTEIYSQHYMDLHNIIDWKTTNYSYIQMRFAYAIVTAYSVIEELGLQINVNVSKNKRSILDSGEWNPEVLQDLVKRLALSNIDKNEHITWMIRGEETKIEKKKSIKISRLAEWADPSESKDDFFISIKDGYVYLPDAINYISFLRSSISSHSVGTRIMELSVFDVANAQHLARRLILEKIKLWE